MKKYTENLEDDDRQALPCFFFLWFNGVLYNISTSLVRGSQQLSHPLIILRGKQAQRTEEASPSFLDVKPRSLAVASSFSIASRCLELTLLSPFWVPVDSDVFRFCVSHPRGQKSGEQVWGPLQKPAPIALSGTTGQARLPPHCPVMSRTHSHPPSQPKDPGGLCQGDTENPLGSRRHSSDHAVCCMRAHSLLPLLCKSASLRRISNAQAALFRPRKAALGQSLTCSDRGHVFSASRLPSTISGSVSRSWESTRAHYTLQPDPALSRAAEAAHMAGLALEPLPQTQRQGALRTAMT